MHDYDKAESAARAADVAGDTHYARKLRERIAELATRSV